MRRKGLVLLVLVIVLLGCIPTFTVRSSPDYPVIEDITPTTLVSESVHSINYPATVDVGDLLILVFGCDDDETIAIEDEGVSWFNILEEYGSAQGPTLMVAWREAVGDEDGGTFTVTTGSSEGSCSYVIRISGAEDPSTQPPEVSVGSFNVNTMYPDSLILTPTGGSKDYLFLSVESNDDDDDVVGYPSNMADNNQFIQVATVTTGIATEEVTASSFDPANFTLALAEQWGAVTIAVHPVGGEVHERDVTQSLTMGFTPYRPSWILTRLVSLSQTFTWTQNRGAWSTSRDIPLSMTWAGSSESKWNLLRSFSQGLTFTWDVLTDLSYLRSASLSLTTTFSTLREWNLLRTFSQSVTSTWSVSSRDLWLSGGWDQRVKITINSTDVDEALTDFPIMIFLSNSTAGENDEDVSFIFDEVGANDKKIAITDSDAETQLYVEIEKWDATAEEAWLWVKVPNVTNTSDKAIYLYYDNDQANNTGYIGDVGSATAENVWDSSYVMVQHMVDNNTSSILDSTQYDNEGIKKGANEPIETTSGQIGNAQNYDGNNDYVEVTSDVEIEFDNTTAFMIQTWLKSSDKANYANVISFYHAGSNQACELYIEQTSGHVVGFLRDSDVKSQQPESTTDVVNDVWHMATMIYDPIGQTVKVYVDGIEEDSHATSYTGNFTIIIPSFYWNIGIRARVNNPFNGTLDEVRISNTSRSTSWVEVSYETTRDHILDFGSEVSSGVSIFRLVSLSLSSAFSSFRDWTMLRVVTQSLTTTWNALREWTLLRELTQGLSFTWDGLREWSVVRDLSLSLAHTSNAIKGTWSLTRTITQSISASFNAIRSWTLSRTITQGFTFVWDAIGTLTAGGQTFIRTVTLGISTSMNALREWSLLRTVTQGFTFTWDALGSFIHTRTVTLGLSFIWDAIGTFIPSPPWSWLNVLVTDLDGDAILSAVVSVWSLDTGNLIFTEYTNSTGYISTQNVTDGNYTITGQAENYLQNMLKFNITVDRSLSLVLTHAEDAIMIPLPFFGFILLASTAMYLGWKQQSPTNSLWAYFFSLIFWIATMYQWNIDNGTSNPAMMWVFVFPILVLVFFILEEATKYYEESMQGYKNDPFG